MKKWTVRVVSLYAFNVAVLLLIGLLMSSVRVGWNALWASVILTAVTLGIKPLLLAAFRGAAVKSASRRTRVGEKVLQYALVFAAELAVWLLTVWFSGVEVRGWFWGYLLPPLYLLLAWVIYDQIDDRIQAKTGAVFDSVQARVAGARGPVATSQTAASPHSTPQASTTQASSAAREELKDGLTPEQRRMLDEL